MKPDSERRVIEDQTERQLLGSILRNPKSLPDVILAVNADDFYTDAHRKIFAALVDSFSSNDPVDVITLAQRLYDRGQIGDVRYDYLSDLLDSEPTGANALLHAQRVRAAAIQRNLGMVAAEILHDVTDPAAPASEILEKAERMIDALAMMGTEGTTRSIQKCLGETYERLDRDRERAGELAGISTGLYDLDPLINGLQESQMIVVGARPGVGKTAIGTHFALRAALWESRAVFFVSLEQSRTELNERMLCNLSGLTVQELKRKPLAAGDAERIGAAGDRLRAAVMEIDDTPRQTALRIAANVRRLKAKGRCDLVVVDYLQRIEPENRKEPRYEQVSAMSRALQMLARESVVPVVALAQINRASEDRKDKKPRLSDLRESGGIEADADTVLILHRPPAVDDSLQTLEIEIAKQRNGPTGEIRVVYRPEVFRFENYAGQQDPFRRNGVPV